MKNALVIQHVGFEDLGNITPVLETHGYRITTLAPPFDHLERDASEAALIIVLGGPMSANDGHLLRFVEDELQLARSALRRGVPLLGICLGAQIIALAAGGTVVPMGALELGLAPVHLTDAGRQSPLRHVPACQPLLHWHGEAIVLPSGAALLARSDQCPVQAFSIGHRVLGLQFHLETDLLRLAEWTHGHSADVLASRMDPDTLHVQGALQAQTNADLCRQVIGEWIAGLEDLA